MYHYVIQLQHLDICNVLYTVKTTKYDEYTKIFSLTKKPSHIRATHRFTNVVNDEMIMSDAVAPPGFCNRGDTGGMGLRSPHTSTGSSAS